MTPLERYRPFAERLDFWASTEAAACDGDEWLLSAAHYAEFIWPRFRRDGPADP